MKRRYLTAKERAAMVEAQNGLCGCGCGRPVDATTGHGEHYLCVWFGNEEKPDAIWRTDCHKEKTARDRKAIAKTKRILAKRNGAKKRKSKPIPSRGFQGHRKFDGTRVWNSEGGRG